MGMFEPVEPLHPPGEGAALYARLLANRRQDAA